MTEQGGYEVIRFVQRGSELHAVIDSVDGMTLYEWIGKNSHLEKKKLFHLLKELLRQMILFSKQKNRPSYRYLSPHHVIIVRADEKVLLSSLQSTQRSNVHSIDKHFRPMNEGQDVDIYCFGKMIQFIMAHITCDPDLTFFEEYRLQRIVKKCLETDRKKQYPNLSIIQKNFVTQQKPVWKKKYRIYVIGSVLLLLGALFFQKGTGSKASDHEDVQSIVSKDDAPLVEDKKEHLEENVSQVSFEEEKITQMEENQVEENKNEESIAKLSEIAFRMGVDYFLEFQNYDQSIECFDHVQVEKERAMMLKELANFMLEGQKTRQMKQALRQLEDNFRDDSNMYPQNAMILMRIYARCGEEEDNLKLIALAQEEELIRRVNELSMQLQKEMEMCKAKAYEELEDWNQAEKAYRRLWKLEEQKKENGKTYEEKMAEMQVKHLQHMNEESVAEENMLLTEIQRMVEENPKLIKEKAFVRFAKGNGIRIEGGKVWIEKPPKREDAG